MGDGLTRKAATCVTVGVSVNKIATSLVAPTFHTEDTMLTFDSIASGPRGSRGRSALMTPPPRATEPPRRALAWHAQRCSRSPSACGR